MAKPSKTTNTATKAAANGRQTRKEGRRQEAGCPPRPGHTWRVSTCPFPTPSMSA